MNKAKASQRRKLEQRGSSHDLDVLQAEALRAISVPNQLDARLLNSLLRRDESLEPAGPLAGK
jgi:hypothetical protein